jgi:transcription factor C subunit 6
VTWLSASNLAVGFANGFLAIWEISEAGTPENKSPATLSPSATPPKPWLYMPLHQSYILAITSAYPSYPHLISTSSIDGYARLTDLRAPTTDYCLSVRSRSASPLLSFSPSLLSILSTEENDFARLFPLRSFHSSISFARATGSPLSLAANYFHPSVLMGCADGSLIATNPLPRVCNRKWPYYQQVIFRHEWTRGKGGTVGDGGISRITESYKVTKTRTSRTHKPSSSITVTSKARPGAAAKKSQPKLKAKAPTGTTTEKTAGDDNGEPQNSLVLATIHEENTGITQVVWNPNLKCGGWIAAGMGSGLVRVQDLAV